MNQSVYRRSTELMEAEVGDEIVALDPAQGNCFGFNAVATSVWRELARPKTFDELRDVLLDQYEVAPGQCSEELKDLLASMRERKLIECVPGRG